MRIHLLLFIAPIFALQAGDDGVVLKIPPVKTSLDFKGQRVRITFTWGSLSNGPQGPLKLTLTADLTMCRPTLGRCSPPS